ncbi:MAG: Fic family protein [Nitrospirae bacterium]|nr:Fic family protein [Nitrospirota bacterium]
MSKNIDPKEIEAIVQAVSRYPEGVGIEELFDSARLGLSRRTLQRRLSGLIAAGRLSTKGEGRALRYLAAPYPGLNIQNTGWGEAYVPVSSEGQEVRDYVRQAPQLKKPVSYNSALLEDYIPNETAYLPEVLRSQLHSLGRVSGTDRPAGTFAREILNRLLIDLSWASSRLEGNTYSRLDTQRLIEFGQSAEGKDAIETQMILNHKNAIEMLVGEADLVGFNTFTILNLHAMLSDGLLANPQDCGRLRQRPVEIGGSVYIPLAMPQRLEGYFRLLLAKAEAINDPFEQSLFAMVHISYLQPFMDVNKRVSRLAANIPLIKRNLCPLSFIDVPERAYVDGILGVYEMNRVELLRDVFVWAYERSCQQYAAVKQSTVPPDPFRIRYRSELTETMRRLVRDRMKPVAAIVRPIIPTTVLEEDRERFTGLVLAECRDLHVGNIARFGIRPSEYAAWRESVIITTDERL